MGKLRVISLIMIFIIGWDYLYDNDFATFLGTYVEAVGKNVVIIVMSDHGTSFGGLREDFQGYYESSPES